MQYLSRWFLYNTIAYGSAIRSELRKGNQSTKVLSLRLWWSYAVLLLPRACARLSGLFFGFLLYAQSDVKTHYAFQFHMATQQFTHKHNLTDSTIDKRKIKIFGKDNMLAITKNKHNENARKGVFF